MKRLSCVLLFGAASVLFACGGDDGTGPDENPNNNGTMTALIDGQSFNGSAGSAAVLSGTTLGFGAVQINGSTTTTLTFIVNNVTGNNTYSLATIQSGFVTMTEATGSTQRSWNSTLAGGGGQVLITQVSNGRLVGSFNFTAPASTQTGAIGTKNALQGQFNLTLTP